MKTPFDTTELEKEIEEYNELKKVRNWDFRESKDCIEYARRGKRLEEIGNIELRQATLKERQRLRKEVLEVIDEELNMAKIIINKFPSKNGKEKFGWIDEFCKILKSSLGISGEES